MYQALGRAVKKNGDGTFTVKVEILDDRTSKSAGVREYTVPSVPALRAVIATDLQALVASEQDAALSAAIVNVLLGAI